MLGWVAAFRKRMYNSIRLRQQNKRRVTAEKTSTASGEFKTGSKTELNKFDRYESIKINKKEEFENGKQRGEVREL